MQKAVKSLGGRRVGRNIKSRNEREKFQRDNEAKQKKEGYQVRVNLPEFLKVIQIQHFAVKVRQHEREDGILHEVIEWASRHFV